MIVLYLNIMPKRKRTEPAIPSEDILPKLLKVLDLIVMAVKRGKVNDVYTRAASDLKQPKNVKTVAKKCVELVSQSACSQRYEESAKLLTILCQDTNVCHTFVYKATILVLENLQFCDKDGIIFRFLKEVQNFEYVNKKETVLDYIIWGFRNNFSGLSSKLKDFRSRELFRSEKCDTIGLLLKAYCAYIDYAYACDTDFFGSDSQFSQASQMSIESTIEKFRSLITSPGDWDIFVLKLIEMLFVSGKEEEVIEVLINYAESNPNHLNAHIYVCEFLKNYDPDSKILIQHLEAIAKICPSDERVLLLIEKRSECEEQFQDCLKLAFMFLDYPSNGNNSKAWKILSGLLCRRKLRKEIKHMKRTFWNSRCRSWDWMYFNPSQIGQLAETDLPLVALKVSVLSYFDDGHKYIEKILKKFPSIKSIDC
ncbi:uncharacterized protein TNCT_471331 [Trichonephila clavata]|uniref:Uncharacterized protein n=1 Tax=Trichonephila clavata TaxID=2740835 RepID=A0A8X6HG90_TRICU|nr:uncharacterized protein TNCT_471331 [Trichonephila clavata]